MSKKVATFSANNIDRKRWDISDESKVTNSFSNFFENAIHSLGIKTSKYSNNNYGLKNPVEITIKKYEQHPSGNLIKENISNNKSFHFLPTE